MSDGKNRAFMNNPVAFLKRYSVCPADDIEMYIGDKATSINTTAAVGSDYVFSTVEPTKRVAWLNFARKPRKSGVNMSFIPKR